MDSDMAKVAALCCLYLLLLTVLWLTEVTGAPETTLSASWLCEAAACIVFTAFTSSSALRLGAMLCPQPHERRSTSPSTPYADVLSQESRAMVAV